MRVGIVLDDDAELRVVAVIGAGIVLEGVDRAVSDAAHGTPEEIAEIDDQIGSHAVDFMIDFFRLEDFRPDIDAVGIGQSFKFGLEFVAQTLYFFRLDDALRLAPLDIEEDTRVVATVAPDLRAA